MHYYIFELTRRYTTEIEASNLDEAEAIAKSLDAEDFDCYEHEIELSETDDHRVYD